MNLMFIINAGMILMVDSVRMLVNVNESNVCYKCRNDSNGW